jgi:ABC-type lipoprotein release transport system permease subunit
MAWRNLFRAPGRNLTTGGVVALVVFLSLVFLSLYGGVMDAFFRLLLERTGHLVVRVQGYGEKEGLEELAFTPPALDLPPGARVEGVLEGVALLIAGERSRPILLTGLEAQGFARYRAYLAAGRLPLASGEALLGEALARALKVGLGEEVVAYAPGGWVSGCTPSGWWGFWTYRRPFWRPAPSWCPWRMPRPSSSPGG